MKGLIIKSTGTAYIVYLQDGTTIDCHVKGNFRIRGIRSTNPVAVGDYVEITKADDATYWITDIYDRRNYIIRRSTNLSHQSHIIAANIDMAVLMVTINHPKTSTIFLDRFLATCEAYSVPACVLFNKIDMLSDNEQQLLTQLRTTYERIGYKTFAISALDTQGEEYRRLLRMMGTGVTLLSGNSGVGKSTLLNAILGQQVTRTGRISTAHDKGMHTTTFSEMYRLPVNTRNPQTKDNAWVIDTPGIKGFGVLDMQREEVSHYFRDIFLTGRQCRYSDCLHMDEPDCAVRDAVNNGTIALSRYESYLSMLNDITEEKYR